MERLRLGGIVDVGVLGDDAGDAHEGGDEPVTVAEVATIHEFGDPENGIPRRSFIRDYVDQYRSDLEQRMKQIGRRIVKGDNLHDLLEQFGLVAVGEIQTRIANKIPPPLSKKREEEKGSPVPLIDTGQLRSSITHRVEVRRGGGR
jgi:hypothetical protein